ncbi:MAG: ABC transporter ATP-binding protein [Proteobacteria bacterium]|nr:ABC transporter ATP-binding protein [Pseudomonadota bacterium]
MVGITLQSVSIDFPVYNSRSRGLINTIFGHSRREQNRVEAAGMGNVCVHALHDISLALKPGDRIGLIGRNGAGKTTLLRVLSGVYEPTRGLMAQEGRISSLTDIMLGMDLDASGYDNIVMRGIVMGLDRRAAIALIPEIESFTELGEYLQLPVRTYSQGMLLRLAFAVSTSITPDILLMDEMIGAGDASFVKKAQARINGLIDGVSILVLASHNESILQSFCTTGIMMKRGRIELIAPIDECLLRQREDGEAAHMQL